MNTLFHPKGFIKPSRRPKSQWLGITHITAALAAAASLGSVQAAVIYQEDFSSINTGWSIGTQTQGTVSFANAAPPSAAFPTRSLELSHVPANTTRLTSTMPNGSYSIARTSTDLSTFQFDLRMSRTDVKGWATFLDITQTSQLLMFVHIDGGDFIVGYWNGSANVTTTLLSGYSVDTTYTFTFTTTPSTGLFSAEVSGGTAEVVDGGFRRTGGGSDIFDDFNSMQIYNDGGSASGANFDMYVDNILIETVPEPTTVVLLIAGLCGIALRRTRNSASIARNV